MRTTSIRFLFVCACGVSLLAAAACRRAADAPPPAAHLPAYMTDVTIKDLMLDVIDPSADVVWLSVTTVANETGLVETRPQNDEEWAKVRQGALTLAEAANLLMMPGRKVAPPDHKSEVPGIELEGHEMDALIANSRGVWEIRAKALHDAAMSAYRAAVAKDADKIFEVGETIENACEGCHSQYWYPNEKIPELPK
jgi:cytochrome c556